MRRAAGIVAGLLIGLVTAAPAAADHNRSSVPAGLTNEVESAHFVLHYGGSTTQAYAEAGLADFEESYGRLVGPRPPTGTNAGLEAPTPDADGKTDVYLGVPTNLPGFSGGLVRRDSGGSDTPGSAYVFMTPDLGRTGFRFRAAHELMHVIQIGYAPSSGSGVWEATANWAAEWALPDIEPGDHALDQPQIPFDCAYGQWNEATNVFTSSGGTVCWDGYKHWLFYQHLTEHLGVDVIHGLLEEVQATCPGLPCAEGDDRLLINAVLADQGGGTLRGRYALYMRELIDPTDWVTSAPATIHAALRAGGDEPANIPVAQGADATGSTLVDHLGTRYLRIKNFGGFNTSGPNDRVRIQLTRPGGLVSATQVLRRDNAPGLTATGQTTGPALDFTFPADPAQLREFWIPLTNDTETTDDLTFGYTVTWLPGTPTPPANDVRAGAQTVELDTALEASNAYAGGNGSTESPSCAAAAGASRGTWYRFTAPNTGTYTFDARATDFRAVTTLYDGATVRGCRARPDLDTTSASLTRGRTYEFYVGRRSTADGSDGHTVRLQVTGPAAPSAPPATGGGDTHSGGQQQQQGAQTQQPAAQQPVIEQPLPGAPTFASPTAACQRAQRAYTAAQKAVTKAKRTVKKARSRPARRRANTKLKKARKKLAAAKRARDRACAG